MMKRLMIVMLIACMVLLGLRLPVQAESAGNQIVSMDEALTVANNWITLIIYNEGSWGGSETAEVAEIQEFKRGDRLIGYFCRIEPRGFIVISLRQELAPIKAYSETSDLNPESEEGLADVIKGSMERILDWIEQLAGPIESAQAIDLDNILKINYRPAWEELVGNVKNFRMGLKSGGLKMNYQAGKVLLTSAWHQDPPYNDDCPWMNCANSNGRAVVGCVATAGAQIMRYWNWPPYGHESPYDDPYDWPNMPDSLTVSSPAAQINAVAELCFEVGEAAGMDYGCKGSGACFASCLGKDLLDAFEDHFRYSDAADNKHRDAYDNPVDWFNRIKAELNLNRPLPYGIEDHVVVCDGWREIGSTPIRQYHMNYGWGWDGTCQDGCNTWYSLDGLYLGGEDVEEAIINVYPAPALGSWLSGLYSLPSFPYRYFDRDATGNDATFDAGHYLQFLPGVTVKSGGKIQFRGWSTGNTRLFTRGDRSKGILIVSGHIYLYQNGSIKLD